MTDHVRGRTAPERRSVTALQVRPAAQAPWADVAAVFGTRGEPAGCWCQRYRLLGDLPWTVPREAKAELLREQIAAEPTGLLAYVDGEPAGWVAIAPRTAYDRLVSGRSPVPWRGRGEDRADATVWAITCFAVRTGFRRQGLSAELTTAAVAHARAAGARAVEAYAMRTTPGVEITWGELHVGAATVYAAAGFREVSAPTPRRVVYRLELP